MSTVKVSLFILFAMAIVAITNEVRQGPCDSYKWQGSAAPLCIRE